MKRISSSDSLGALMSMCPSTGAEEQISPRGNHMYSREYQSMLDGLDEEGCVEESGHVPEKKRRLSLEQVKALERNFEVENKLEPERKVKLAQELGLQPRQVAVWFQNRRARWKTKQLERDYGVLKSNFDALKSNFDALKHDKEALLKEIKELKSKLNEDLENSESNLSIKEEALMSESENNDNNNNNNNNKGIDQPITPPPSFTGGSISDGPNLTGFSEFKDGPSDSDSSAILNDENSPKASNSSSGLVENNNNNNNNPPLIFNSSSSSSPTSINCFSFFDSRSDGSGSSQNNNNDHVYHHHNHHHHHHHQQSHCVKMEEHNFFGGEEACNFFSVEQAPTLQWYSPDQWS